MNSFSWTDGLESGAPWTSPWIEVCLCSYVIASKRLDFCLLVRGSLRAASLLRRLVDGEEKREAPDCSQGVLSQNWGGKRAKSYCHLHGAQGYG
ncbi:hypothetical protein TNCV_661901 [Trichonephila clavipes]|nr:hypothetical protein TNCV_661901 [Trichonephila clavipes]